MKKLLGFVMLTSMLMAGFARTDVSTDPGTNPAPFSFTSTCGQSPGIIVESDSITVTGISSPVPISIRNGEYSINGGPYTSQAGTVSNGQIVSVRHTTAPGDNMTVIS